MVWAITGAYFINIVFCFLSVFWGSFSCCPVLQTLVWVSDAQEGQVWCLMVGMHIGVLEVCGLSQVELALGSPEGLSSTVRVMVQIPAQA